MENSQNIIRGRYKVIQEISRGGMGVVFLALDLLKDREVAVKKSFFSGAEQARKGFEVEAKLLARLEHEGLPKVRDYFFLEDDSQALVMDFITGETLMDILDSGKMREGRGLNVLKVLDWTIQILDILRYLHNFEPPIVHRDIKPNNIKLTKENKIILLDFGLAKGSAVTLVGGMSGYSPIEQIQRTGTDTRSDIYALGTTLFHLLTDDYPMTAISRFQEIYAEAGTNGAVSLKPDPQKSVIEFNPQVPPMVSEIVMKAMALMPENRFQTADEIKTEIFKAKRSLEYGISRAGEITNVEGFEGLEKKRPLIDENEEDLTAWQTQKAEKEPEIIEPIPKPQDSKDLRDTVSSTALFGKSFENSRSQANLLDNISVPETPISEPILPPIQTKPQPNTDKRLIPMAIGAITLILLASFGIFAWYFLAKPKPPETANIQPNISTDSTAIVAKKDEPPKNIIEITKYGIGKNDKLSALAEDYQFAVEEPFKFGVKSSQDGFLYVISSDNLGEVRLTYSSRKKENHEIKKDSEKIFPPDNIFSFGKDDSAESLAYFVIVSSWGDDLAKRILKVLGSGERKITSPDVNELMKDLDKFAEKNEPEKASVKILKIRKKE